MKINTSIAESFLKLNLLSHVGEPCTGYLNISSLSKVDKSICSRKWENICLEEINDITGFLSVRYPDKYNIYWNKLVKNIKKKVIPHVEKQLNKLIEEEKITINIVNSVLFDIVNIVMAFSYRAYISSEFYTEMYDIYMNGHLPCGWKGKYPQGQIEIY